MLVCFAGVFPTLVHFLADPTSRSLAPWQSVEGLSLWKRH